MVKRNILPAVMLFSLSLILASCSTAEVAGTTVNVAEINEKAKLSTDPITLRVYQNGLAITDDEFEQFFINPVKKKFPYITLELVRTAAGSTPQELVVSGAFPDIVFAAVPVFKELNKLNILADLNDLVKSNKVDLSRFDPATIEAIKLYGPKGELYALPFARAFGALFYNKDLFDKFGVPYPKDGMDWEQAAEIGKNMARVENNVVYRGLEPGNMRVLGHALSLQYIDPKTEQATLNNDGWKRVLRQIQDIYNIANNRPPEPEFNALRANFTQRKTAAMITDWVNGMSGVLEKVHKEGQGLNWDMVTHPNFKERVGIGRNVDVQALLISSTTKHKDQAFAVIDYLTSLEPQLSINKTGRPAAIINPEVEKTYAANLESFKGKNIASIFKNKSAPLPVPTDYDQLVFGLMEEATKRAGFKNEDINTILRETEEKANAAITKEKAGK